MRASPGDWSDASRGFREAVERYFADRGADLAAPHVRSTVRTNTELVPQRGDLLVGLLTELGGRSIEGARVIEVGSGFGALAGYLAWRYAPSEMIALDIRDDYVQSAKASAEPLGLGARLRYQTGDMRVLAGLPDGWADVAILNNAFIYLPTRADMQRALRTIARVVRPGGHVLFYHANRWTLREPFTKDPLVHLLPAAVADGVSRLTGWKHNHGRIRLLSPPAMRRNLARAGFTDVEVGAYRRAGVVTGRHAYLSSFYATAGRRR